MADVLRTKSGIFRTAHRSTPSADANAAAQLAVAMPRPSRGIGQTSASDAASAAEFASKKYVWVPDPQAGYLSAWIIKEEDHGDTSICALQDGSNRAVPTFELSKMNPPKFDKVEDIADLTFLNEASVVHNLRQRYFSGLIYTYSGLFLVAVNPYHALPIYTDAIVAAYKGRRREENAPHVFALADGAMRSMLDNRENQSLLITGESGAGKTENTKKVIQYLAAIAADTAHGTIGSSNQSPAGTLTKSGSSRQVLDHLSGVQPVSSKRLGLLEQQILQANPILEAFGNAQTIRNNNSSRFGKFVRIEFTSLGAIAGANIDWYLLEKSRVAIRSPKERSFHIFYQLLRGGEAELKQKLLLSSSPDDYGYLRGSRKDVEGVDDRSEWSLLREALDIVGFSPEEQLNLFRVAAAILQIGNIELADDRSEQARITNLQQVEKVCHVLGLPEQELTKALLRPRVKAGREWVTSSRTRRQVLDEMAALSKTIYEKAFGWLVDRINKALDRPTSKSSFIGVLDIAGFEIFEVNSFEQLCINYTNEKLQQFFNHHMFVLEQEEYAREDIEWDFVNFGLDLQPTIDLIESTDPIGVLSCLDEECIMPKATDVTFTEKLNRIWATNKDGSARDAAGAAAAAEKGVAHGSTKYAPARFAQGFIIKHYAGDVEYRTEGWLDKNKDPLNDNLTRVMSESTDRFVASLFAEYAETDDGAATTGSFSAASAGGPNGAPKRRVKRGAFRTGAQRHKEQLSSLMTQLGSTQPHFVRCIVPNPEKKPGKMVVPLVLEQLRCNGVLEGIRIARLGYPNRLLFSEFRNRYEVLTPGIIPQGYMDGRKACQRMVEALELDRSTFKIGTSKIFFKAGVLAEMEERRDAHLFDIFGRFQAACRMYTARRQMKKILNRAAAVRTIQRNARLYVELREWPWWQLYTRVRPLLTATRHDEELKRKQLELAMVTERAERDQKEREALEALKFKLENEKKRVEDELESERALLLDKDQLLARSKERESALEDDLAALQADVDLLDGQLEKAIASQKATEQAHQELKVAFDQAADHLLRLEGEQKLWSQKEVTLTRDIGKHGETAEKLRAEKQSLVAERDGLLLKLQEKDQDIERAHKRMAAAVQELEAKLTEEAKARDEEKSRLVQLEVQTRQSSYQLSELARVSSDHETQAKQKAAQIAEVSAQLAILTRDRDGLAKEKADLKARLDTLSYDLEMARGEASKSAEARTQVQKELDETRRLMDAKSSEDVKQKEVHRMKEQELLTLRQQMSEVEKDLAGVKHASLEQINSLKVEIESARKKIQELEQAQADASAKVRDTESRIADNTAKLAEAEKAQRTAEAELRDAQSKSAIINRGLQEALKSKDNLEKQLHAASNKQQDLEDALLELERSSNSWKQKVEQVSAELGAETKRRELLESAHRQSERNFNSMQQLVAGKDKEAGELRNELALTQQEMRKLQSMQNKTIVEHVHVLEEAKKYTDRQLADAQSKLQELAHYTKTLEKSKARLVTENEDLSREVNKLQRAQGSGGSTAGAAAGAAATRGVTTYGNVAPSSGDRAAKSLENKVNELSTSLRQAQQQRDEALSNARRKDLQADEMVSRTRQQYEQRIQALERELKASQMAKSTTFSNIEQLVRGGPTRNGAGSGPDDSFRQQILEQLRLGHEELEQDIAAKGDLLRSHKTNDDGVNGKKEKPLYVYGNVAPRTGGEGGGIAGIKRGLFGFGGGASNSNGSSKTAGSPTLPATPATASAAAKFASEDAERAVKRAQSLQNQLDAVEVQLAAGLRVRAHLEAQVRDMASELEAQNGAHFSVDNARRKMAEDKQRLNQLLQEESDARRAAEMALLNGESSLRKDFRDQLSKLSNDAQADELRAAMLSQQRSVSAELGRARQEVLNGERLKSHLEMEISDLKQRLERETLLRNEDLSERRRLQTLVQEYEINHASNNHTVNEARDAAQLYKAKADSYLSKIENLEMERLKSQKSEGMTKLTLQDTERNLHEALLDRKAAEDNLVEMENRLRELHGRFEQFGRGRELESLQAVRQEVESEFERERQRYRSDLIQREEAIEDQRRRYQQELDSMGAEIEAHRTAVSQLREENRGLRGSVDELQLRLDDTIATSGGWQREKEKLETKLKELTQAYQDSLHQQRENQTQSVQLLAQIRDLRAHLDESELKYDHLAAAYQSLIAEAGVDEEMISSLQQAVERYKAQADSHMENWRRTTRELEQQTAHLRSQATLRRPGSIPPESVVGSSMSPSRLSMR